MTAYQESLAQASLAVLGGLAVALDLPPRAFTDCHGGKENRCRLIHYPPIDTDADEWVDACFHRLRAGSAPLMQSPRLVHRTDIRASAHSDYGSITLLATESVGGLQVRQKDGSWADVQHLPGALIVNIADALEVCLPLARAQPVIGSETDSSNSQTTMASSGPAASSLPQFTGSSCLARRTSLSRASRSPTLCSRISAPSCAL